MKKAVTTLYLIRHGESVGNMNRVFLGHTNLPLSNLGVLQAEATAKELKGVKFDAIYSSDLIRAYMTAEPNAKIHNLPIIKDEKLREVYAGEWENMSVENIINKYGEMYTVDWKNDFYNFKLPGGESIPELAKRIYDELKAISIANEGKTILITMHAAAIRSFWGKIQPEGAELPDCFPLNASYTIVEYKNGELCPIAYSMGSHLSDVK